MKYTREVTKISVLKNNTGQIPGVPKNPRFIKDDNFVKLKQSITDDPHFMELREIIAYKQEINDKTELIVIAGNMRLRACKDLGWQEVPAKIVSDLTPEQIRAIVIKDNVGYGDNDYDALANEWDMVELEEWGLELPPGVGIDQEIEEDEVPELDGEAVSSVLGTVYQLGRHRVMCGDSTSTADVELLMKDRLVDIAFTSPPYNAGKTPTEDKMGKQSKYANDNDSKTQSEYLYFLNEFTHLANAYSEYNFINLQMLSGNKIAFLEYLDTFKLMIADIIIWDKQTAQPAMAENVLNSQFEFVIVLSPKGNRHIGTRKFRGTLSNLVSTPKQTKNKEKDHNATYPVEFVSHFVRNFSEKSVLDLFLGSGSTLIACEQTDRICYGMELDPKYVDVIRKRYAKYCYPDTWEDRWEELTPAIN